MKNKICLLFILLIAGVALSAQQHTGNVYIFSYFNNNGQDGLHLAYSTGGYHWQALNKDSAVLKPTVANDGLMRDPCIIKEKTACFIWCGRLAGTIRESVSINFGHL